MGLRPRRTIGLTAAVLAALIFGATFRTGIDRGMDQMIAMEAHGRIVHGIAAVLTEMRFRTGGYAISSRIVSELFARGLTTDARLLNKLGVESPTNLRSGAFIDSVLESMWRDLANIPVDSKDLRGFGADDIGIVDYTKLAFAFFGHHVRALYYLFFLIYGATIAVALFERWQDLVGRLVVVGTMGIIFGICFYSPSFDGPAGLGNMVNPRFLSTLAIVPMIHVLLLVADGAGLTWWSAAAVCFQATVIFLALHIRSTAEWVPAGLVVAVIIGTALEWRFLLGSNVRLRLLVSLRRQSPALIVLGIVALGLAGVSLSLHQSYRNGGWLHQHAFWHSVYYGLMFHPAFLDRYGLLHDNKTGDEMPIAGIFIYLRSHPDEDRPRIYLTGKTLKYSEMERLSRAAFFSLAAGDPVFVLETFFIYKPALFVRLLGQNVFGEFKATSIRAWLLFASIIALASILVGRTKFECARFRRVIRMFSIALVPNLAIPFLTIVYATTMTEQLLGLQIAMMLLAILGFAWVFDRTGLRRRP